MGGIPSRGRWTNKSWVDPFVTDNSTHPMPWAERNNEAYNFRRRFEMETLRIHLLSGHLYVDDPCTWTDTGWGYSHKDDKYLPYCFRCNHGSFYQRSSC